jgi:hypothetical protein
MSLSEIGPRLKIEDLRERTVVVVTRADRPSFATMWVERVFDEYVMFQSGLTETKIHFLARRLPGGKMVDDTGAEVQAFQYLGKV